MGSLGYRTLIRPWLLAVAVLTWHSQQRKSQEPLQSPLICPALKRSWATSARWAPSSAAATKLPRGSKYPISKDSGPKSHSGYGFWIRILKYWVLGPSGLQSVQLRAWVLHGLEGGILGCTCRTFFGRRASYVKACFQASIRILGESSAV